MGKTGCCCTADKASYHGGIDNLELVETGGAWRFKTGGAADAVDNARPASPRAFEKASAVSSSEFRGFSFFCRRTFRCRHNFFGSPLLSVIFRIHSASVRTDRCFFWASVVQANRSLTSRVIMLFICSATLGCGAIRVESRCCWFMATAQRQGACLSRRVRESGVVHLLKVVN